MMNKSLALITLLVYFGILLFAVSREKKNESIEDYFFAGRSLPFWMLSITFIASWWGAGSALSTADLAFEEGMGAFWYYGVPVLLSSCIIALLSSVIRKVGFFTQGEMLESRYSQLAKIFLGILVVIFMTLSAASQMVGIGHFFGSYLGLNYTPAILLGTSIVLIYSMFGGFRGVVFTDIIQFVLLLGSAIIVFIVANNNGGGFNAVAKTAEMRGLTNYTSITSGALKYLPFVITFGSSWSIQANVWQRISAARNEKDAKKLSWLSFFVYIPLYLIVVLTGMAALPLYNKLPEGGVVTAIVQDYMGPVLSAFVFVGISAAIMSTMDSLINTASMTLSIDLRRKKTSTKKDLNYAKIMTLVVTVIALLISLKIQSILTLSYLASNVITCGILVPLLFGFFFKKGNSYGAVSSMIFSILFSGYNLLLNLNVKLPHFWQLQEISEVLTGLGGSLFLYLIISLVTKSDKNKAIEFINRAK